MSFFQNPEIGYFEVEIRRSNVSGIRHRQQFNDRMQHLSLSRLLDPTFLQNADVSNARSNALTNTHTHELFYCYLQTLWEVSILCSLCIIHPHILESSTQKHDLTSTITCCIFDTDLRVLLQSMDVFFSAAIKSSSRTTDIDLENYVHKALKQIVNEWNLELVDASSSFFSGRTVQCPFI